MDDTIKRTMDQLFGRHRGGLWRSERDWYAFGAKNTMGKIKEVADNVRGKRAGLYNEKGFSRSRKMRWMGDIPTEIAFANPELIYDPEAVKRFFREHPDFSSKGW